MGKGIRKPGRKAGAKIDKTFNVGQTRAMKRRSGSSKTTDQMEQFRLKTRRENRSKNKVAKASRIANRSKKK